jgi:hypothetical protein
VLPEGKDGKLDELMRLRADKPYDPRKDME